MSATEAAAAGSGTGTAQQAPDHSDDSDSEATKTGLESWFGILGSRDSPEHTQTASLCGSWSELHGGVVIFEGVPKKLAASMGYSAGAAECFAAVEALYLFDAGVLEMYADASRSQPACDARSVYATLLPKAGNAAVYKAYCQLKDAGYIVRVNRGVSLGCVPYVSECLVPDPGLALGASTCPQCVAFEVFVRLRTDYARSRPGIPMARVVMSAADAAAPVRTPAAQLQLLQACAVSDVCAAEQFATDSKAKHRDALQGGAAAEFLLCLLLNSHTPPAWRPRAAAAVQALLPAQLPGSYVWDLLRAAWPLTTKQLPAQESDTGASLQAHLSAVLEWTASHLPVGDSHGSSIWHAVVDGSVTVAFLKAVPCHLPPGDTLLPQASN